MTSPEESSWDSLKRRSLEAWGSLYPDHPRPHEDFLQNSTSFDDFLSNGSKKFMFWFFQQRDAFLSQKRMTKWSRDYLDSFILLPAANGYVRRSECFFISHFWRRKDNPDPDGKYLRLIQQELRKETWSYVWVDWTCAPQDPRSESEEMYFQRTLQTVSGIIRNSGFMWWYPPFEPRLWILYEVAESMLTSCGGLHITADIKIFANHIAQMYLVGVRPTLERYGYTCTNDRDKEFRISWLELLVLLTKQRVDIVTVRHLLDQLTWQRQVHSLSMPDCSLQLYKFQGTLILQGVPHKFKPFPEWVSHLVTITTTVY